MMDNYDGSYQTGCTVARIGELKKNRNIMHAKIGYGEFNIFSRLNSRFSLETLEMYKLCL